MKQGAATSSRQRFGTLVITLDPQYPWTEKTDNGESKNEEVSSEELIREQYQNINSYSASGAVDLPPNIIMNGNITAYGWMENIKNEGIT
ncbi:hypothetical protein ERICIV_04077 [Paenibacillus larvae subsp. larvae]|uniref:Uncharacterized protein n=1 Tax=Paenibacillus larvae subsp. larvae TaxID=147375 RepID=A0A2L1UJ70_9BACL|nr:hypothetical protein [Paenibacillus larvae]AQT84655.1 hypothetical protein B1222_10045 [Paenibacillus larvae subsp. pulvifaciens]AQZ46660.1 hypothetical protein B5S25_08570 [Paenibacillus larvae subsp. pulvifaciens]AVF28395.1 hypothetical protein ERICIII_04334 [Paenibacillus larvae subsp. larvae]AVF32898.1 hypothetical protein ERICIV_04077 [Paenibacillus larvae subsp. larvae]MBH0342805.1 hypothetical protein [Paenibacillus larvae]